MFWIVQLVKVPNLLCLFIYSVAQINNSTEIKSRDLCLHREITKEGGGRVAYVALCFTGAAHASRGRRTNHRAQITHTQRVTAAKHETHAYVTPASPRLKKQRDLQAEPLHSIIRVSMCDRTMWPSLQSCYQPHAKVNSKGLGN